LLLDKNVVAASWCATPFSYCGGISQ